MPSTARQRQAAAYKDRARLRELARAKRDLYWLGCKLGYKWTPSEQQGMTEDLHGPMCARMDRLREHPRVLTMSPRKSCKSTVFTIVLGVQEILRDPDITIMVNHAVGEEAEKIVQEMGNLFQHNKWLRSLDPVGIYPEGHDKAGEPYRIMPHVRAKKFVMTAKFTVNRAGMKPTTQRQPTALAKGAGAEATGAHCDLIFLDDIIGRNTIEDSLMPRIRDWYRQTTLNVLNTMGRIRCVGTRWSHDDIYADFLRAKSWDCLVRHARETDGEMDYKGQPIHYGPGTKRVPGGIESALKREEKAISSDEMGYSDYAAQRMNDPSPAGEKKWNPSECEHYLTMKEASGPGVLVVLSDPAPAKEGSAAGWGEKKRGDGTKDDWATCVIKIRAKGQRQEFILVDGDFSKEWGRGAGLDRCAQFMCKYGTSKVGIEVYGGLAADYELDMRRAARLAKTPGMFWIKFANSYIANAKNERFGALADLARDGRFYICETCPPEFVKKFLEQARNWRPLPKGRNSNRFDDCADVVSRCTDSSLQGFAPQAEMVEDPFWDIEDDDESPQRRSRYCVI